MDALSGWSSPSRSSAALTVPSSAGPPRNCAADSRSSPPTRSRVAHARDSTAAAVSSVSSVCHSRASHNGRPSRGSRPGFSSASRSRSQPPNSASAAIAWSPAAVTRPASSGASASSSGTWWRISDAVPANCPTAVSRWMRGQSTSTDRAVASASGIAESRPARLSSRTAAGANGRAISAYSSEPGLCSSGSHSCPRTSVYSNSARSTVASRIAWSTRSCTSSSSSSTWDSAAEASRSMSTSRATAPGE